MSHFFDSSETRRTQFSYTDTNNPYLVTTRIDPNGAITRYTYKSNSDLQTVEDPGGNITEFFYAEDVDASPITDKHRHLLRKIQRPTVTVREGTPNETFEDYDPTELEYDSNGNLIKIIDAKAQETILTYSSDGLVETITDRNGHTTEFVYEGTAFDNSHRRLLQVKVPKGLQTSDGFRTVTFGYNDADNPDNVTSVTDDLSNVVTTEYDSLDRVVKITDPRGKVTEFEFIDGLLEEIKLPANNASGTDPRLISFVYNSIGVLTEVNRDISSSAQQTRVRYEHNGFFEVEKLIRLKDSVEKSFAFERNALGNVLSVEDPLGHITTNAWQTSCFGHSTTTPTGLRRRLGVDLFCRVSLREAGTPAASSFDQHNLASVRESNAYHYDELGRLVRVVQTRPYPYGEAILGFDRYGLTEERTFHYDELDRLVEMAFEDGRIVTWEYDPEGNVTKMTDPEGKVTRYSYYRDNLLHQVIIERPEEDDRVFTYSYDAAGRLEEIEYPEDTEIKAIFRDGSDTPGSGFDGNGNIRFLRYEKDSALIRRYEWTYDDSNNRESMLEVTPTKAVKWEYGFDWLDRLVTVKRAEAVDVGSLGATTLQREYVFDESDNRVFFDDHVNDVTYHYVYATHDSGSGLVPSDVLEEILVSSTAGDRTLPGDFVSLETFEHDEEANLIRRTLASTSEEVDYTWTEFNNLEKIESSLHGRIQVNRYESEGLRERTLDKNNNSAVEYGIGISTSSSRPGHSNSEFPTISYIQGAGGILGAEIDGEFQYFLPDALGSNRDLVDDQGNVIRSFEWDEYGNLLSSSGSGTVSPKTFVGGLSVQDEVADTGLYMMGHRFYEPTLGRFLNRDPIGFAGGMNLFSYGANNPVNFVDAWGLAPYSDPGRVQRLVQILKKGARKDAPYFGGLIEEYLKEGAFSVVFDDDLVDSGRCDNEANRIELLGGLSDEMTALILLHEFLHFAIANRFGFVPKEIRNRRSIGRTHPWIYAEEATMYETLRNRGVIDPSQLEPGAEALYNGLLQRIDSPGDYHHQRVINFLNSKEIW